MKKRIITAVLMLVLCLGLCATAFAEEETRNDSPEVDNSQEQEPGGDTYDWEAFSVTVTPDGTPEVGKEATFHVTITNNTDKIIDANVYHWYYREWYNSQAYPGVMFGTLIPENGDASEEEEFGIKVTFGAKESCSFKLVGVLPDTWDNDRSEIMIVVNGTTADDDSYRGYGQGNWTRIDYEKPIVVEGVVSLQPVTEDILLNTMKPVWRELVKTVEEKGKNTAYAELAKAVTGNTVSVIACGEGDVSLFGYSIFSYDVGIVTRIKAPEVQAGDTVVVLHLRWDGEWEQLKDVKAGNGEITVTSTSFSPIIYIVTSRNTGTVQQQPEQSQQPQSTPTTESDPTKSPNTGSNANTAIFLLFIIALGGAAWYGKKSLSDLR